MATNFFTKLSVLTASATFSLAVIKAEPVQAFTYRFDIDPTASFISSYTSSPDSVPFSLADLGINPGDTIELERFGTFSPFGDPTNEYYGSMWSLFSTDNTLLPSSGDYNGATTERVPGAIDPIVVNGCLEAQCLDNGIFYISRGDIFSSIVVQVPNNAQYLFIGAADSVFDDNVDSDGDFDVTISSVTSATVPEPGFALGSLVFGTYSIGWRFLRKRQKSRSI